jgi:hypothetical protein
VRVRGWSEYEVDVVLDRQMEGCWRWVLEENKMLWTACLGASMLVERQAISRNFSRRFQVTSGGFRNRQEQVT